MAAANETSGTKLVIAALVTAVLAVIAVNVYISQVRAQVQLQTFTVYLLQRSLEPGDKITQDDVRPISVPFGKDNEFYESFRVLGALTDLEMKNSLGEKVATVGVKNQVVTHVLFIGAAGSGLDQHITAGMRWMTIAANSRTVPPILQPEMHVDIEAPFATGNKFNEVMPVMENVRVVAVGAVTAADEGTANRRTGGFQNVTIEITPEQATSLATIEQAASGPFELHLRNPGDDRPIKIPNGGINERVLELVAGRAAAGAPRPNPTRNR